MLDGSADGEAVDRLTAALRTGGKRQAVRFAERLAATLYELDREALFNQPVRWSDDPEDEAPIPLSGDTFLYLRADIVAKGKAVVERVLADPAVVLTRRWDDGEALLYAASAATGDEIEATFSYKTGSNEQHWSPVESDTSTHQAPIVAVLLSDPGRRCARGSHRSSDKRCSRWPPPAAGRAAERPRQPKRTAGCRRRGGASAATAR